MTQIDSLPKAASRGFEPREWLDWYYETSRHWGFILSTLVMLVSYSAVGSFLLGLNFESNADERYVIASLMFVFFGTLAFGTCAFVRVIFKWQVHPLSLGIAAALAQYFGIGIASDISFVLFNFDNADKHAFSLIVGIPIASTIVFVLFYRWIHIFADERTTLPKMVEIAGAVAVLTTGLNLVSPELFAPSDFKTFFLKGGHVTYLMTGTPLLLSLGALISVRKGSLYRTIWIWPVLFAGCLLEQGFERGPYIAFVLGFGLFWITLLSATVVPMVMFLLRPHKGGDFAQEFFGSPDMPLLNRRDMLFRDLVFAAAVCGVGYYIYPYYYSIAQSSGDLRVSVPLTAGHHLRTFAFGMTTFVALLTILSFVLRALKAYRLRIGLLLATALMAYAASFVLIKPLGSFVLGPGIIWLQGFFPKPDNSLGLSIYSVFSFAYGRVLAGLICLGVTTYAFSKFVVPPSAIAIVLRSAIGIAIAAPLVVELTQTAAGFPLSEQAADLAALLSNFSDDAANQAEIAASSMNLSDLLLVALCAATLIQFIGHGGSSLAILVWPINAIVATATLNLIFAAQTDVLNSLGEQITTGTAEALVSVGVGLAIGQLFLLGKRLWYDRDPTARADAIRLRGGLLILHGIAPLLVLLLIFLSVQKFTRDIADETKQITAVTNALIDQGQRLGQHYSGEAERVKATLHALEQELRAAAAEIRSESKAVSRELVQIADDSVQAMENSATAVATKAEEAVKKGGGRIVKKGEEVFVEPVKKAVDELGFFGKILKKLADAFPDLDLQETFGAIFSWDAGFDKIFDDFKNAAFDAITAEFNGPKDQLIAIANRLKGKAETRIANVDRLVNNLSATADDAVEHAQAEYLIAVAYMEIGIDNMLSFINHLFVLCFFLGIALVCLLLWRIITGLSTMIERVTTGWAMLVYNDDKAAQAA